MASLSTRVFGNRYQAFIGGTLLTVVGAVIAMVTSYSLAAGPGEAYRVVRGLTVLAVNAAVLWVFLLTHWRMLEEVEVARHIAHTLGALLVIALCGVPVAVYGSVPLALLFASLASAGWGLYLCRKFLWEPRRLAKTKG